MASRIGCILLLISTSCLCAAESALKTSDEALVFATHRGEERLDIEIRKLQKAAESEKIPSALEQLGWHFVAKARASFDPGFYLQAQACARLLDKRSPHCAESLLLNGHVQLSLHQFKDAEKTSNELTQKRGLAYDFGLLGDALMEQGKLEDAAAAYQRMADLKPGLQTYSRAAHMAFLRGDVSGAEEFMRQAIDCGGDSESLAWVMTKAASYQFQLGANTRAEANLNSALRLQKDYPPALLLRGRMLLAKNDSVAATEVLKRAAEVNPLPEYQWLLADAYRGAGKFEEARTIERKIQQRGAANDARTYALFLATRGEEGETALRLARAELSSRADVHSHDALAIALWRSGKIADAWTEMEKALAEKTEDARLFLHAALISNDAGRKAEALSWIEKATAIRQMLFPSENELLQSLTKSMPQNGTVKTVQK